MVDSEIQRFVRRKRVPAFLAEAGKRMRHRDLYSAAVE